MSSDEYVDEWVEQHEGLERDGNRLVYDGEQMGSRQREDEWVLGPHGDGGVVGEPVGLDDGWLYVRGERHYYDRGPGRMEGKFAVQPGYYGTPEIDGPLPEE